MALVWVRLLVVLVRIQSAELRVRIPKSEPWSVANPLSVFRLQWHKRGKNHTSVDALGAIVLSA